MNQELLNNKELQDLIAGLGTDDEPDQPLGKYGRMAMDHLHKTNPQRFSLLTMTSELMNMMYRVDEEASEKVEAIIQRLLQRIQCRKRTIYWLRLVISMRRNVSQRNLSSMKWYLCQDNGTKTNNGAYRKSTLVSAVVLWYNELAKY